MAHALVTKDLTVALQKWVMKEKRVGHVYFVVSHIVLGPSGIIP